MCMKIISDSYELDGFDNRNYEKLAEALRTDAMMHSVVGNREQFYMPGEITLQLRRVDEKTFLDVTRTSWNEPKYVKNLVKMLGGRTCGGSSLNFSPDITVKQFLIKELNFRLLQSARS